MVPKFPWSPNFHGHKIPIVLSKNDSEDVEAVPAMGVAIGLGSETDPQLIS